MLLLIRDAEGCALGTADDYLEAFAAAGFELVEHTDKTEFAKTALKERCRPRLSAIPRPLP